MPHLGKGLWIDKGNFAFGFTSSSTYNVAEGQTAVGTVQANKPSVYLNGGPDGPSFDIDVNTGVLTFLVAPDFENPGDVDFDNIYHIMITALNISSGEAIVADIYVTVTDVVEQIDLVELVFDDIANADAIVGDSSDVADWNTAFGSPASPFTSVVVVGNIVKLYGGSDIAVPDSLFSTDIDDYGHLISITDTEGVITSAGYNSFGDYNIDSNGTILETAILPALVTAGDGCFNVCSELINPDFSSLTSAGYACFQYCSGLINPDFSSLTSAGDWCFTGCTGLVNPDFSSLTSAGYGCFNVCISYTNINLSSLTPADTSLGGTSGDNGVFNGIIGKVITLTVPAYFMTNNTGNPDGDIQYLITNNTVGITDYLQLEFDLLANASGMIGGDATLLADWNTAFAHPVGATPFTSIYVQGNKVYLGGGANIVVPDSLFSTDWDGYGHLISIVDTLGCIIEAGYNSFGDYDEDSNGTILEKAMLPALVTAGEGCFYSDNGSNTLAEFDFTALVTAGQYCFDAILGYNGSLISDQNFSSLITAGDYCFRYCSGLINPDFSSLTSAGDSCFRYCTGLINPDFSSLTSAGDWCFTGCTGLVNPDFSSLTSAGYACFTGCTGLVNPDFSSLTSAGDLCFQYCISYTNINLSSLTPADTSLGGTSGDDNVFLSIIGKTIILTVPAYFMTNNSGGQDGDIAYLVANNTSVTIINT